MYIFFHYGFMNSVKNTFDTCADGVCFCPVIVQTKNSSGVWSVYAILMLIYKFIGIWENWKYNKVFEFNFKT